MTGEGKKVSQIKLVKKVEGGKAEPLVPRLIWPPCHLVAVKDLVL